MARQRLGQHYLTDASWRERIARQLRPALGEVWLEIGAGHGEMTELLARQAAGVCAVELDASLARRLRERAQAWPNVEVLEGDILSLDLPSVLGEKPVRVYGNLPYYIASAILTRLFEHAEKIADIHVVIQWEVAVRITARPKRRDYGYLSVLAQYFARPEIALRIPPGAFRPRPKVTSALVRLRLPGERAQLGIQNDKAFLGFVQGCFAQKRKTLANNLRAMLPAERVAEILRMAGVPTNARAEELGVEALARLFSAVGERESETQRSQRSHLEHRET